MGRHGGCHVSLYQMSDLGLHSQKAQDYHTLSSWPNSSQTLGNLPWGRATEFPCPEEDPCLPTDTVGLSSMFLKENTV